MAEVIDLHRRQTQEDRERQTRVKRRAPAVAAALACGCCPRRCAFCGQAIDQMLVPAPQETPFPFCGPCQEEYQAFRRRQQGQAAPEAFWHTAEWLAMWRGWLEHMQARERLRGSPEFLRLMQENQP